MYRYLILCFSCICFCVSCKNDSKSELFIEYVKNNYLIELENKDITFIVYSDPGCSSCNNEIRKFIDSSEAISDIYIIYLSQYPEMELHNLWKEKYKERLFLDRTSYIKDLIPHLNGSGKIVIKNGEIFNVKTFNPVEVDFEYFIKDKF